MSQNANYVGWIMKGTANSEPEGSFIIKEPIKVPFNINSCTPSSGGSQQKGVIPLAASDIVFLASCNSNGKLKTILEAAKETLVLDMQLSAQKQTGSIPIPNVTPKTNQHYVYAYFRNASSNWKDCFYIGKGTDGRYVQHITETLNAIKTNGVLTVKQRHISEWIMGKDFLTNGASEDEIIKAANGTLVRILYSYPGQFSEQCAFAAEYVLIRGVFGVYQLSNLTQGNRNNEDKTVRMIMKNHGLNLIKPDHKAAWEDVVGRFLKQPDEKYIYNRSLPLLHLLATEKYLVDIGLDQRMSRIGLQPVPMRKGYSAVPSYISQLPQHYGVSGAGDACITYIPTDANVPLRFQLKLSYKIPGFIVNIKARDNNKQCRQSWGVFLDKALGRFYGGSVPKRKWPNDPFFKPFRIGTSRDDYRFPLNENESIDVNCCWLNGQRRLNLDDALKDFTASYSGD